VGLSPKPGSKGINPQHGSDASFELDYAIKPSPFFTLLKKSAPDKWKKAVLEFTKLVSQKIDIPREG
jgi:hypothetical protein